MKTITDYENELDRLRIVPRWGECRRFHSDTRKIERRNWLIDKISTMKGEVCNWVDENDDGSDQPDEDRGTTQDDDWDDCGQEVKP